MKIKNYLFLLLILLFSLPDTAGVLDSPEAQPVIIRGKHRPDHTEYNIPTYLPEVWYDEDAWTLLVQGHNYYTYFNYYILDADGDCQLSGGRHRRRHRAHRPARPRPRPVHPAPGGPRRRHLRRHLHR